ncbi:MAG: hypothetical protein P8181_11995, partial [bacterium]
EEGRSAVEALRPIWTAVGECTDELILSAGEDLLSVISEVEKQLDRQNMFDRVTKHMKAQNG